jgi:hypothetical protein
MNCANWEERIALYMGEDLERVEAVEVERHLGECPGCQVFASGIRESMVILRQTHVEDAHEAASAAVRARVMAALEKQRQPWWRSAWVYSVCAAAMLLLVFVLWPRHRVEVAHREAPAPQPLVIADPPVPRKAAPVRVMRVRRQRRPAKPVGPPLIAAHPAKPLVVKLVTDDPDVVIYWITDTTGE